MVKVSTVLSVCIVHLFNSYLHWIWEFPHKYDGRSDPVFHRGVRKDLVALGIEFP